MAGYREPAAPSCPDTFSKLHLWYGGPDEVVLACEPIPLAAILRPC